jgi:lysophospholipase L1-like esterase
MSDPAGSPSPLSPAKRAVFAALSVALALATLEGAARLVVAPRDARIHREHENLIRVLGLPSLNATMEFDSGLFWKLRDGLDKHNVAGQIHDAAMSFNVSTHDSLRSPPIRSTPPALRVLAVGDSCTFGLGVDDAETWPAQLETSLRERGLDAEVINAGVPGYTAFQGQRWFEARGLDLKPDILVLSFGFNDRESWSSRSDADTARLLQLSRLESLAAHSRIYTGLRRLLRAGEDDSAGGTESPTDSQPNNPASDEAPVQRLSPQQFYDVVSSTVRRAQDADIGVVLAAWPYRAQVDEGVRELILYQLLLKRVADATGARLVNLAEPFIDAGGALFVDHVHATPDGNRVASEALLPAVLGE